MSTHTSYVQDNLGGSSGNLSTENRIRLASETDVTNNLQVFI